MNCYHISSLRLHFHRKNEDQPGDLPTQWKLVGKEQLAREPAPYCSEDVSLSSVGVGGISSLIPQDQSLQTQPLKWPR